MDRLQTKKDGWQWNEDCDQAFNLLKQKFTEQPVLMMPDKTKPFILETDASEVASGAVL